MAVEFYIGRANADDEIVDARRVPMTFVEADTEGVCMFEANSISCHFSGVYGYQVRVLPDHADLATPFLPGLITWAE